MPMGVSEIFQGISYGAALLFAAFKILQSTYKVFKDCGKKNTKDKDITININNDPCQDEEDDDKKQKDLGNLLYLLSEQQSIQTAVLNMKSDILKEQMDYYIKHVENIYVELENAVVEMMREAGLEDEDYTTYFANFANFMEMAESRIQKKFRKMCKDNHFAEYDDRGYRDVIEKNIKILDGMLQKLVRTRYLQRNFLKNFKIISDNQSLIVESIEDCLIHARDVAIERQREVYKTKEDYEAKVSKLTGMSFKMNI